MPTQSPPSAEPERNYLRALMLLASRGRPKEADHDCYVCGKVFDRATEFKDAKRVAEYGISGQCQGCQDHTFADPEGDDL